MAKHTSNVLAYTAGIMDGEGCIGLVRKQMKKLRSGQALALQIEVIDAT